MCGHIIKGKPRRYFKRYGPELILLLIAVGIYIRVPFPASKVYGPDLVDNLNMGIRTAKLANNGPSYIFQQPDTWFRYVQQAIIARVIFLTQQMSTTEGVWINWRFVQFVESIGIPLGVYTLSLKYNSRKIGIVAIIGVIFVRATTGETAIIIDPVLGSFTTNIGFSTSWYFIPALPFALGTCLFLPRSENNRQVAVLVGIMIGLVGSIQLAQGLSMAVIVVIYFLSEKWVRPIIEVGSTAAIIFSPTIVVAILRPEFYTETRGYLINISPEFIIITVCLLTVFIFITWFDLTPNDSPIYVMTFGGVLAFCILESFFDYWPLKAIYILTPLAYVSISTIVVQVGQLFHKSYENLRHI